MKKQIIMMFAASAALLSGCHEPDELLVSSGIQGLNSVSAQFATGPYKNDAAAKFTTLVTEANIDRIVIDVPWFYPESSDNRSEITQMRVTANIEDNCFISPDLGTLDLTQENRFTLTRPDGSTRDICITGNIKKSDKCEMEEFTLPELGLTGIIDQTKKEISIIAVGELPKTLASYRLSFHATLSPDPAVTALDYNVDQKLTVTAYDGVTKQVYTVKKNVPNKVKSGIRPGSGKVLYEKTLVNDLGITTANMTGGMAVTEKYIVLNTRNENSVIINRATGEKVGMYELPAECKGSLVNFYNTADRAGNILLCNLAPNAGTFKIWRIAADLQSAPQLFIEYGGGEPMGRKISVQGSIDADAIITAPIHNGDGKFARWQVKNGALVSATPDIVTVSASKNWSNNNVDIIYTDPSDIASDYYATYYGGGNVTAAFDGTTNAYISGLTDIIGSNYVSNSVDYVKFNNRGYMCFSSFNGFTWGGGGDPPTTDCCWMMDADSPAAFSGDPTDKSNPIYVLQSKEYRSRTVSPGNVANGNTTGDIAFYTSSDGYMLYMYLMITNGHLVAWQFDCIDQ